MQFSRILAVHGYEIYQYGKLGELSEAICKEVLKIQEKYSHIILLGGWHLREAGPLPTIGDAMYNYLCLHNVPFEKMRTQYLEGLTNYMPPRDSMEEIDLLPTFFKTFGFFPQHTPFDAICIQYFVPRLRFLYRNRNARCQQIIGVSPPSLHIRRIIEQVPAYFITRLDPEGKGTIVTKNRDERTLYSTAGFPNKNLPSAWNQ